MEEVNPYKANWYQEVNAIYHPVNQKAKQESPHVMQTALDLVKEEIQDRAVEYVVGVALLHMAQSQIDGPVGQILRTSGRFLTRAIPIIGTAYAVYSVYDWLTD